MSNKFVFLFPFFFGFITNALGGMMSIELIPRLFGLTLVPELGNNFAISAVTYK